MGYLSLLFNSVPSQVKVQQGMVMVPQELIPLLKEKSSSKKLNRNLKPNRLEKRIKHEIEGEEFSRSVLLRMPHKWHTFKYWDIHAYFQCAEEFSKTRPLYSFKQWMRLRDFYNEFVSQDLKEEGDVEAGHLNRSFKFSNEAFNFPFEGISMFVSRLISIVLVLCNLILLPILSA
jgi:hypothetical protein